jgi:undecaprenyl-diphosphatase
MSTLTYPEAMVIGLLQGVSELFPVSSLGHSVLIPAIIGGSWAQDLNVSKPESPYLAYIVGLHVATAAALICYFWRDWLRIIGGLISSLRYRRVATANERLAWMIILATIPVGIAGLALEHAFRVFFSKPVPTALFLTANGLILLWSERRRKARAAEAPMDAAATPVGPAARPPSETRPEHAVPQHPQYQPWHQGQPQYQQPQWQDPQRQDPQWQEQPRQQQLGGGWPGQPPLRGGQGPAAAGRHEQPALDKAVAADSRLSTMGWGRAVLIGTAQILALLPGISRDGIATVVGMGQGLRREDAVRYSFLLSTPVILAAGVLKVPDLAGPLGAGIRGQVLAGSLLSFVGAYLSVRFLTKYFSEAKSLRPFGIYCLVAGLLSLFFIMAFR